MQNSTTTCSGSDIAGVIAQSCTTEYGHSTSTDQTIVNGFTSGEIVLSIELFMILVIGLAIFYHLAFRKIKIKN